MVKCNKLNKIVVGACLLLLLPIKASAISLVEYPIHLQNKLKTYTIVQYTKPINTIKAYSYVPINVQAVTDYGNHKIILRDTGSIIKNLHIFHHESGHVFDTWNVGTIISKQSMNSFYSNSIEFCEIYTKESNSTSSYSQEKYSSSSRNEYFAECFAIYIENQTILKKSSPLTYAFIDRVYTSMKQEIS